MMLCQEPSPIKEATNIAPTAKTQTVGLNEKPNAKNSIGNNGNLPMVQITHGRLHQTLLHQVTSQVS